MRGENKGWENPIPHTRYLNYVTMILSFRFQQHRSFSYVLQDSHIYQLITSCRSQHSPLNEQHSCTFSIQI
jgi:hypothetical protein